MKVRVSKDEVFLEQNELILSGEYKIHKFNFEFSEDYLDDLVYKAIFGFENKWIEVPIINNECDIPNDFLVNQGLIIFGVYAYQVVDDKLNLRYSPKPTNLYISNGSYREKVDSPREISTSDYEKYMQALQSGLNKVEKSLIDLNKATNDTNALVEEVTRKLENGEFIGPKGDKGDCNFATFEINLNTGNLEMNKTEGLLLDFTIENGKLEVLI